MQRTRLLARRLLEPRGLLAVARRARCSGGGEDPTSAALARVLADIKRADPGAQVLSPQQATSPARDAEQGQASIKGVKTPGPKMVLRFSCTHEPCEATDEDRVTTKVISKRSYEKGALYFCSLCAHTAPPPLPLPCPFNAPVNSMAFALPNPPQASCLSIATAKNFISLRTIWPCLETQTRTSSAFWRSVGRRCAGSRKGIQSYLSLICP